MTEIGLLYTVGLWKVKKGNEKDFLEVWQQFALWTEKNHQGAGLGRLLQDIDQPDKFISFGSWDSEMQIGEWRSKPEFKAFIQNARELCEDLEPGTFRVVGLSDSR